MKRAGAEVRNNVCCEENESRFCFSVGGHSYIQYLQKSATTYGPLANITHRPIVIKQNLSEINYRLVNSYSLINWFKHFGHYSFVLAWLLCYFKSPHYSELYVPTPKFSLRQHHLWQNFQILKFISNCTESIYAHFSEFPN